MRIVSKDKEKREQERKIKELQIQEDRLRKDYLAKMRENRSFKRFIVEGIIRKRIDELDSLGKIPNGSFEEMGKVIAISKAAKNKLETMLSDILNG